MDQFASQDSLLEPETAAQLPARMSSSIPPRFYRRSSFTGWGGNFRGYLRNASGIANSEAVGRNIVNVNCKRAAATTASPSQINTELETERKCSA